jgi:hypothetical protein
MIWGSLYNYQKQMSNDLNRVLQQLSQEIITFLLIDELNLKTISGNHDIFLAIDY